MPGPFFFKSGGWWFGEGRGADSKNKILALMDYKLPQKAVGKREKNDPILTSNLWPVILSANPI